MRYLTSSDYSPYIRTDNLQQIINQNEGLLEELELAAIQRIAQYTESYFETDCLFPLITEYDNTKAYTIGEYVSNNDIIYVAPTNIDANNNISQFEINDPRNALIKQFMIDIILFDAHSRVSPNQLPSIREARYNTTIMNLKDISKGLYGGLPSSCRDTDEDGNVIAKWGSEPKKNNYI